MSLPVAEYEAPHERARGPVVWAAAAVCLAGLALVALGGCFLVGVMLAHVQSDGTFGGPQAASAWAFVGVLYACAAVCFTAAAVLLVIGVRRLLAVR